LRVLSERFDVSEVDRLWIFPPMIRGRREWGLVAASLFTGGAERRRLLSVAYMAEETGEGVSLTHDFDQQGEAPADRLPRVIDGVVRRAGEELGEPREIVVDRVVEAFEEMMKGFEVESAGPSVEQ